MPLPCGGTLHPEEVVAPASPGRKVVLLGDTSDSRAIEELAHGADVVVHEATLPDAERRKALSVGHSTPVLAGEFAAKIAAHHLVLTHFSNKHGGPHAMHRFVKEASKAFGSKRVVAADDFTVVPIPRRGKVVAVPSEKGQRGKVGAVPEKGQDQAGDGSDADAGDADSEWLSEEEKH